MNDEEKLIKRLTEDSPILKGRKKYEYFKKLIDRYQRGSIATSVEEKYLKMGAEALKDESAKKLDVSTQRKMEEVLGEDFKDVRIHTGEFAKEVTEAVGAKAFTINDRDIFFGKEQFKPTTPEGLSLLAHELSHVQEKRSGIFPSLKKPHDTTESEYRARLIEKLTLAMEEEGETPNKEQKGRIVKRASAVKADRVELNKTQLTKELEDKIWKKLLQDMKRDKEKLGLL